MKQVVLVIATLFLASCVNTDDSSDQTYTARYAFGPEVNSVTLCNSKTAYWVAPSPAGKEILNFYQKNFTEPYQSLYVKFRGRLLDEPLVGEVEQDYDGLIHLSEVEEYSFDLPASCPIDK